MIWTLLVGLVVGAIAKLIMPGKNPGGIFVTMLLGVGGAFLASWVGTAAGWYEYEGQAGIIASVIGAMALVFIYQAITGRTTHKKIV